jgi:ketosteroid isomerase-like protein
VDTERNKEIVRRQFEYLSSGDVAAATALWAPEGTNNGRKADHTALSRVYESLKALQERHVLHEMVAEGDWVAVRTTCRGVHSAEPTLPVNGGIFTGVSPTDRIYEVGHIHLFEVRDGLITAHWANRDDLGAARQTGVPLDAAPK